MKEKYALLDTDFISKTHLIRKDEENKLIDRITEMPGYRFYCHEQIKTELQRRYCRVPCEQVIDEMYAGKFDVLQNGNLRYKE